MYLNMKKTFVAILTGMAMLTSVAHAQRGADGQLKLIYWQAPSILNPYLSGGSKDTEASSLVLEPLANFDENGNMVPVLAQAIPQAAGDLKSITWKLKAGIVWSDGTPFTAEDVVFTAEYCKQMESCATGSYRDVSSVEKVDDLTVKVNFSVPKPFPYELFVSAGEPILQKAQFQDCLGDTKALECTEQNFGPVGTGPFKVTEFRANDVALYAANEQYRDAGKPHFATVLLKGGGDAASAARSVLETGEFDFAWNLQIEPEVMLQMEKVGKGKIVAGFGTAVERLILNLSNPDTSLGDNRSTLKGGRHPFLNDPAVRRALSLAIDRQILVDTGYGRTGQVTCNVVPAPAIYVSTANDWCKTQDVEKANMLLDMAGWQRGEDGVREKDGVRLSILYQTSTNTVRQDTQALIKQMWQRIGVETELKNISGSVFFGSDPGSPDTYQKFYADIQMYTNLFLGVDPEPYMGAWICSQIPSPENQWQGGNVPRYCDAEYNELVEQMSVTASLEKRAVLVKRMNDMLVDYGAIIPLIHRGRVSAHVLTLGGIKHNVWDSELWNVEDWHRIR